MTTSITHTAIVLSIIARKDPNDSFTLAHPPIVPDFTKALNHVLKGKKKLACPRHVFLDDSVTRNDPSVNVTFEQALEVIKSLGAMVVDPADLPSADEIMDQNNEHFVSQTNFKIQIDQYLAELLKNPSGVRSLADLIAFQ